MKSTHLIALTAVLLALGSCDRPDANRTASGSESPTVRPSAAPAPPQRGPIPGNANTMAPGTDASVAMQNGSLQKRVPQPSKGGTAEDQHRYVQAQQAAAMAPDTASADAAKQKVLEKGAGG